MIEELSAGMLARDLEPFAIALIPIGCATVIKMMLLVDDLQNLSKGLLLKTLTCPELSLRILHERQCLSTLATLSSGLGWIGALQIQTRVDDLYHVIALAPGRTLDKTSSFGKFVLEFSGAT